MGSGGAEGSSFGGFVMVLGASVLQFPCPCSHDDVSSLLCRPEARFIEKEGGKSHLPCWQTTVSAKTTAIHLLKYPLFFSEDLFFCLFFSIFPATAIILNNTSPSCYYQRQRLYSAMENYSEGTNHLT